MLLLDRVGKLVVKAVWKLAYKQILVSICKRSKASKAPKGFIWFFYNFIATVLIPHNICIYQRKAVPLHSNYGLGTTVERRSSDGQATVKANVQPKLPRKLAKFYVLYYIIYLYIIYFLNTVIFLFFLP